MSDFDRDLAQRLRSLSDEADTSQLFVQRMVAAVRDETGGQRRPTRRRGGKWGVPLLAAVTVGSAAAAVIIGTSVAHNRAQPAHSTTPTITQSSESVPTSASTPPSTSSTTRSTAQSSTGRPVPAGFTLRSLYPDGAGGEIAEGYTSAGRSYLIHRAASDTRWSLLGTPPFGLHCTSTQCVNNLTMVTAQVGYGHDYAAREWMTTDGGRTWKSASTVADRGYVVVGNSVITVEQNCTQGAPCQTSVRRAPLGTQNWASTVVDTASGASVPTIAAQGGTLLMLMHRRDDTVVFERSTDLGRTWRKQSLACQVDFKTSTENLQLSVGADAAAVVECYAGGRQVLLVAPSGGSFGPARPLPASVVTGAASLTGTLTSVSANRIFVATDVLWRSEDQGRTWAKVPGVTLPVSMASNQLQGAGAHWSILGGSTRNGYWATDDGGTTFTVRTVE